MYYFCDLCVVKHNAEKELRLQKLESISKLVNIANTSVTTKSKFHKNDRKEEPEIEKYIQPASAVNLTLDPISNLEENFTKVQERICNYYKRGNCRHGSSGKNMVEGKVCKFSHPRKCYKFCRYGYDETYGCNKQLCNYFHPILCSSSLHYGECYNPKCTYQHLYGTVTGSYNNQSTKRRSLTSQFHNPQPSFNYREADFPPLHAIGRNLDRNNIPTSSTNKHPVNRTVKQNYHALDLQTKMQNSQINYAQPQMQSFPYDGCQIGVPGSNVVSNNNFVGNEDPLNKIYVAIKDLQRQNCTIKEEINVIKCKYSEIPQSGKCFNNISRDNNIISYPHYSQQHNFNKHVVIPENFYDDRNVIVNKYQQQQKQQPKNYYYQGVYPEN